MHGAPKIPSKSYIPDLLRSSTPNPLHEKEEVDLFFEETNTFFEISSRLFGNRHCPAYLDNTSLEGAYSEESLEHWIKVLSLWIEGKGIFFPVHVKREHYERLIEILNGYLAILKRYKEQISEINDFCREEAKFLQKEIKKGLDLHKVIYIPLGYTRSFNGSGHCITAKCTSIGQLIEVVFLNIGEGAQLHPELNWSETSQRLNFQSFPIQLTPKILFGEDGMQVLERVIRLQVESGKPYSQKYEAKDIYGAFWLLGNLQSSYGSKPINHAKKPQIDMNCADMAITLLLKDVLIDFGYDKKQLQRFFCNELLCNLLCYYNQLKVSDKRDEWLLLRAGLESFSIHILHLCENSLDGREVEFSKSVLSKLFLETSFHLKTLRRAQAPITLDLEKACVEIVLRDQIRCKKRGMLYKSTHLINTEKSSFPIPSPTCPAPEMLLETLQEWNNTALLLHASGQKKRAYQFVYRSLMTLPIPDPHEPGYWDMTRESDRSAILHTLSQLTTQGLHRKNKQYPSFYKQIFILHIGYAIADKLARLNEKTMMHGFASPFFPTNLATEQKSFFSSIEQFFRSPVTLENRFEFSLLPLEHLNRTWSAICHYFETHLACCDYSLFAVSECEMDIRIGVHEIASPQYFRHSFSETAAHIHYLKQFLPAPFQIEETESQLASLWLNENGDLPNEYNILYFFAYYAWGFFTAGDGLKVPSLEKHLEVATREDNAFIIKHPIPYRLTQTQFGETVQNLGIDETNTYGCNLLKARGKERSENESLCCEFESEFSGVDSLTTKHYRHWSRIFSTPSLQVSSTLQWLKDYLNEAKHKFFQNLIEVALFEPGILRQKMREEPMILAQYKACIQRGIEYFNTKRPDYETQLFFIYLGICLETFSNSPELREYEQLLLLGKHEPGFDSHLLLLYQIDLPRGKDSLKELIKAQFSIEFFHKEMKDKHWIWEQIEWSCDRYQPQLIEAFQEEAWIKSVAEELVSLLDLQVHEKNAIKAIFPIVHFGIYTFDIEQMTVKKKDAGQLIPLRIDASAPLAWMGEDALFSFDESMKYKNVDGKLVAFKELEILGEDTDWYYSSILEKKHFTPKMKNHAFFKERHTVWVRDEPTKLFVILDGCWPNYGTPRYLIDGKEGSFQKLTENDRLVLLDWHVSKELSFFFKSLGSESEVFCWAKRGSSQIEEMDFLTLGLSFKREEGMRMRCVQMPQYCLSLDSSLEEINQFRGSFILENEWNKQVVLPARCLAKKDSDFTTDVYLKEDFVSLHNSYFIYQVDEEQNLLISDDPIANFFLTLLFTMQRDYKKALRYLPRSSIFEYYKDRPTIDRWLDMFRSEKEHSPEALAFNLRIGLHLFENQSQLLQRGFQKKEKSQSLMLMKTCLWLGSVYEKYIRALSTKEENTVPGYIRLTWEEEAVFLKHLKSFSRKYPDAWRPICTIREQLVSKPQVPHAMKTEMAHYSTCRTEYSAIPVVNINHIKFFIPDFNAQKTRLPSFVRMSHSEIKEHFILLYDAVKQKKQIATRLNIFYLLRSQLINGDGDTLCALLLYVHTYSHKFSDLIFGDDPKENVDVFYAIVKRAFTLNSKMEDFCSRKLEESILFNYQATVQLKLGSPLKCKPLQWQFSSEQIQHLAELQEAFFQFFCDNGLSFVKVPLKDDRPFALDFLPEKNSTFTEKRLVQAYRKGHARLLDPKYGKIVFNLSTPYLEFLDKAYDYLKKLKDTLAKVKLSAEDLAGSCPEIDYRLFLRKKARDLPHISIDGLLSDAYSKMDPLIIRRANPSLSPSTIYECLCKTIEYHLVRIQIFQLENAIKDFVKGYEIQAFGETILTIGKIDPTKEPELILFQSRTGKVLYTKQMDVLDWHHNTTHKVSLFAAPAGGGKTTIFQPIAMQRIRRQGITPVSISPQSLYLVDREGLASAAAHALSLEIEVMEIDLNTSLTASDFQRIYERLLSYSEKKGLKITPEVYYAIDLKYQLLLETGRDCESIRYASLILDFFRTKTTALIDESRINASPFSQAKIGLGLPLSLPATDHAVFLAIYQTIVSNDVFLEDKRSVNEVVRLTYNLQATMQQDDFSLVKKAVLMALLKHPLFEIPEEQEETVFNYWMYDVPTEKGRAVDLVKIYFDIFFSSAMKLVGKMKHVRSLKSGEMIHVPAHKKQATRAYFEEVYVTLFATIQGVLQDGLSDGQIDHLIETLHREHTKEITSADSTSIYEQLYQSWMKDPTAHIKDNFIRPCREQRDYLQEKLQKNTDAIFWYLENHVLKQAVYSAEQLLVTPVHLINAFQRCTLFSADPGPQEIYGLYGKTESKIDRTFLAEVIHQLSDPKNETILTLPHFSRPLELFEWLFVHLPEIYLTLSMLADGGMLRDFRNYDIAQDFFLFLQKTKQIHYDGLILFEDNIYAENEGQLQLWMKDWGAPKPLKGHDVPSAIAALGLRWEDLNLLTLIDPSRTTGANVKQKEGASALILLAEDFSLGEGIQTVMRMRDFLNSQRVFFGILEALKTQISQAMQSEMDPSILKGWMLKNEAERTDKEIQMSAFQFIAYYVEKPARDELNKNLHDPRKQVAIWKRYRNGFVKKVDPDLIKRFKQKRSPGMARTVLLAFAEEAYNRFGYSTKWKDATSVHKAIEPHIVAVEKSSPMLSSKVSFDLMQKTHMHVSQMQNVEVDQIKTFQVDIAACPFEPLPAYVNIGKRDFIVHLAKYSRKAADVFGSKGLTDGLWFTKNAINTAKAGKIPLKETYLKPIQYVLVLQEAHIWSAFALSDSETAYFQKQLVEQTEGTRKAALINTQGAVIQNGKGTFAFSQEELCSEFIVDILIDVGLSRCELYHMERFLERLENWDDFWPMWNQIKSWQMIPEEVHGGHIERLIPQEQKKEKEPEQPKKGFFSWFISG